MVTGMRLRGWTVRQHLIASRRGLEYCDSRVGAAVMAAASAPMVARMENFMAESEFW